MDNGWQDMVVGARMAVDREFNDRVQASSLSNAQWGLVMTAVEFEIEDADDPENARVVANTSKLEHVLPEMQDVDEKMSAMGGGGDASGGGSGVVGGIKNALGLGGGDGGGDEELAEEATQLADEYADALQSHLESEERWDEVRRAAADD